MSLLILCGYFIFLNIIIYFTFDILLSSIKLELNTLQLFFLSFLFNLVILIMIILFFLLFLAKTTNVLFCRFELLQFENLIYSEKNQVLTLL